LPKRLALPEIFLFVGSPIIFIPLFVMTLMLLFQNLPFSLFFLAAGFASLAVRRIRHLFINGIQSYIVLLGALVALVTKKKFTVWETPEERKIPLDREVLEKRGLI
jgi:hypothetical protein